MGRFRKLRDNPTSPPWPLFPSVHSKCEDLSHAEMALVIDGQDRIMEFSYRMEKATSHTFETPLFEALGELVQNRLIHEVETIGWDEFDRFFGDDADYLSYRNDPKRRWITRVLQLFHQGLDEYRGRMPTPMPSSPLICRCFGVFREEIIDYIKTNGETNLKTLTGGLLAGGGCTRCKDDLVPLIEAYKATPPKPFMKGRAQLVLGIYESFCRWRPSGHLDIDILDISSQDVTIDILERTTEKDILGFEQHLKESYSNSNDFTSFTDFNIKIQGKKKNVTKSLS
ncbi:MAG: (2Fe-2S)-binding protein [Bacteriovoracales bacterium]|nr:(2Fe-2S)-binding protein [Bacteriovoracales bacterium]